MHLPYKFVIARYNVPKYPARCLVHAMLYYFIYAVFFYEARNIFFKKWIQFGGAFYKSSEIPHMELKNYNSKIQKHDVKWDGSTHNHIRLLR